MVLGGSFFKWINFAVQALRLLFKIFGNEDDKKKAVESETRSKDGSTDAA